MKWVGQSIIDFIARFRGDVYLDSPTAGGSDPDKFLGIDSNGKIIYRTGTQVASDIGAASGDITGVTITADDENSVSDTSGSADFTIAGTNGIATSVDGSDFVIGGTNASTSAKGVVELATTAETTTGTDTGRAVTPDGLKDGYQGSSNVVTLGTIGTGVWNGTAITKAYLNADQGNITQIGTITAGVWNGTAIAAGYVANGAIRVYGATTIKLLPSDFVTNEEGGATKHGIGYMDHAGASYGMKPTAANTDLVAFTDIPEGKKATHVAIYDKNGVAWEVFEVQINANTMTSKGTGTCNAGNEAITNTNASATNFLAIVVSTTATSDRVFGGLVTIADQ